MKFKNLGLCAEILTALEGQGYDTPTPVQEKAIPAVLEGRDVMAAAQTGTGKTAGFTLPILQRLKDGERAKPNQARVLIITPTRELAAQVHDSVATYGRGLNLSSAVVFGGVKINPQMMKLRRGVDILVATPGRLLDLYQQNAVKFPKLEVLVLDEADRMLDMGFIHDIKKVFKILPPRRQNLLFSATFSDEIRALAKSMVNNPVEISVTPPNTTVERIEQRVYPVTKSQKSKLLMHLLADLKLPQVLVFTRTKHGANRLAKQLDAAGFTAAAIHGNKSQGARTKALQGFKDNQVKVLVATDIAARGLDIEQLPYVVNYDLPQVAEDYVHRIGRTGRAGATGHALSLVTSEEIKQLRAIERFSKQTLIIDDMQAYKSEFTAVDLSKAPPKSDNANKPRGRSGRPQSARNKPSRRSRSNASGSKPE